MTRSVLVALTVVSLVPAVAHGATVIAPFHNADVSTEGFDVFVLIDGTDHVLASVDPAPAVPNPFGDGLTLASDDIAMRLAAPVRRDATIYDSVDAAREPLPEPATWLMMILGFFGLSFAVRRRASVSGDRVRFS